MFIKTLKTNERGWYYYELHWNGEGENGFVPRELIGCMDMDAGELRTIPAKTTEEAEERFQRVEKRVEELRKAFNQKAAWSSPQKT